mmetsp:Transcript_56714/g.101124  ORF Transcript_56714/g.101124 Transcript_56714/m.101124 type:complete len:216 (+) Transcript_56714:1886-2533(+)
MVVHGLHQCLHNHVAVQQHEVALQVGGNADLLGLQVLVRVKQDPVGHTVAAHLLLLLGDDHRCLGRLLVVAQRHVQPEDVVGVFGLAVRLTHEVVDQLGGQCVRPGLPHHVDGLVDLRVPTAQIVLQGTAVMTTLEEVIPGVGPVTLRIIILGNGSVVVNRPMGTQRLSVCFHLIMLLSQFKCLSGLLCQQQKFNSRFVISILLAMLSNQCSSIC